MNSENIINKKNKRKTLSYEEIEYMVKSFIKEDISEEVMTLFIKAIYEKGLSKKETYYLTDVMVKSGNIIDLSKVKKTTVDKHSSGGVGDKISLLILPICASLGLAVPKMSGRSLGITGGTIDKLESIPGFKSELTDEEFINIINTVGCADICQNENIALADKKIYALRDKTGYVDSIPLIASSIMSKKIACSAKNIVIDLKVGKGAFMKDLRSAKKLARLMIYIGKKYEKNIICILSDMNSPLGSNVGNILEVKEVINFFEGNRNERLEKLTLELSAYMLMISKNIKYKEALKEVVKVIKNGKAKDKFYEWIKSQGGRLSEVKMNAKRIDVKSVKSGFIKEINAEYIGSLSSMLAFGGSLGSKIDNNSGIILRKKIGDFVERDEILCSIYYNKEVEKMISQVLNAYIIINKKPREKNIILKVIK